MKGVFSSKSIMQISILYRLASMFLMLTMIFSQALYVRFRITDTVNLLLIGASFIALVIYWQVGRNERIIAMVVYVETVLLLLIYLVTGGLHSPIIWLVTTPAVFYLFHYRGKIFIRVFFLMFGLTSLIGPYVVGDALMSTSFLFFPSFIMATTMMLLVAMIAKQYRANTEGLKDLDRAHELLQTARDANSRINHWLNNSYSFIENLLASDDEKESVHKIFSYSAIAIPAFGFYLYVGEKKEENLYCSTVQIKELLNLQSPNHKFVEYEVSGVIKYATFGMVFTEDPSVVLKEHSNKIELILKITALFFERNELMIENEELLIANEQQRIAEEMHDGLNQDIHGTTYMLYDVLNNYQRYELEEIIDKIQLTYDTILGAGHSLKRTIYQLSSTNEVDDWEQGIHGLVIRLSKQYGLSIDVNYDESIKAIPTISPSLFDSFRRIIKEAVSNAFEHGGANRVELVFVREGQTIKLKVKDDGTGFTDQLEVSKGLGLKNMKKLTEKHSGALTIVELESGGACIEMRFAYET